jgi:hypothetical protein
MMMHPIGSWAVFRGHDPAGRSAHQEMPSMKSPAHIADLLLIAMSAIALSAVVILMGKLAFWSYLESKEIRKYRRL